MEQARAILRNVRIAPRKMQLVVDLIRGKRVSEALNILKFEPKAGADYVEKLLLSAVSNWENKNPDASIEEADLYVKEIFVTQGKTLKRFRPAPQGRAHRIRKRSNHVTLIVDSLNDSIEEPEEVVTEEENKD